MARTDGIACDFCEKELGTRPHFINGKGWDFVWFEREFGSASLAYAKCSDCCAKHFDQPASYVDTNMACIRRAHRHSKSWGKAADRFVMAHIEKQFDEGSLQMVAK